MVISDRRRQKDIGDLHRIITSAEKGGRRLREEESRFWVPGSGVGKSG